MKKSSIKGYAILGILFLLVSIIAFAAPTPKSAAFWIAYTFTVVAFAAQIPIWKSAFGKEDTLKSKFLGFPVVHIGIVYAIIQAAALAVFMFAPTLPAWSATIVCSLIAGIAAVCIISGDIGRNEIEHIEASVQKKVFYIKALQADIEILTNAETDKVTKAALEQLAEKIRFSDPMSHEQLADLEIRISNKTDELKSSVNKSEIIRELTMLLDERNKKCKILK